MGQIHLGNYDIIFLLVFAFGNATAAAITHTYPGFTRIPFRYPPFVPFFPTLRKSAAFTKTKSEPCTSIELESKDIDIVLFGSTGFMGSMFAEYFLQVKDNVRWALAGRNKVKLMKLTSSLANLSFTHTSREAGFSGRAFQGVENIVADLRNSASLLAMTKRAKVVLSVAGPYEMYGGEALIQESINGCAHYVDISTETHWRSDMFKRYNAAATSRGVIIVQSAGFASLAADFVSLSAARDLVKDGQGPPDNIYIDVQKMNGAASGGAGLAGTYTWNKYHGTKDPYVFVPEARSEQKIDTKLEGLKDYGFNPIVQKKISYYPGARNEPLIVRRTMFEEFPGAVISVKEATSSPMFDQLKDFFMKDKRTTSDPPPMNPKPGEGPPRWVMDAGSFQIDGIALRHPGEESETRAQVTMAGAKDPSIMSTVRLATELILALLHGGSEGGKMGFRTPANSVGVEVLEQRLKQVDDGKFITIMHGVGVMEKPAEDKNKYAYFTNSSFTENCSQSVSSENVLDFLPCISHSMPSQILMDPQ